MACFIKTLKDAVAKESKVKPLYQGTGSLMLKHRYKYLVLEDIRALEKRIVEKGMFYLSLSGNEYAIL